jgi:uncharacterized protein
MTTPLTSPTSQQITAAIQSVLPDAAAAWLYGSAASGSMKAESDIDIAVLLPPKDARKTSWSLRQEAQSLGELWHRKVDLVNFSAVSCILQKEILSAGKHLFSNDEFAVGNAELLALSQYRNFNERNAEEFARIARTGKVFA